MLLKWEQLDLEWLAKNRPQVWQKKQEIERLSSAAFKGFFFQEDKNSVFRKIKSMGGLRIAGELMGDSDPDSVWVTLDPKTFGQLLRFSFNDGGRLIGMEVHQNFSSKLPLDKELKAEWKRLVAMVEDFYISPAVNNRFPSRLEWRRFTNQSSSRRKSLLLTQRWEDPRRQIELGLASKAIDIRGGPMQATGNPTFFGVEIKPSSAIPADNTNWLIYSARMK